MAYRRRNGSDTWHFCRNCSNWPTSNYVEQQSRPTTGELDDLADTSGAVRGQ
jgi:hypothetical protein